MMNIRKIISSIGYPLLRPLSACMKMQTSKMSIAEARRIVAEVYDLNRPFLPPPLWGINSRMTSTSRSSFLSITVRLSWKYNIDGWLNWFDENRQ